VAEVSCFSAAGSAQNRGTDTLTSFPLASPTLTLTSSVEKMNLCGSSSVSAATAMALADVDAEALTISENLEDFVPDVWVSAWLAATLVPTQSPAQLVAKPGAVERTAMLARVTKARLTD